ncbi:hypothetical protein MMC13_000223 [Lambiella insularis]|nr:hypothetical protein [Lambiella insularis]
MAVYARAHSTGNLSTTVSTLAISPSSACVISCIVFAGGILINWPATTVPTIVTTVLETVFVNNGTPITSAQPLYSDQVTTALDSLYVPSLYSNGTVAGNGVEFVYPTVYVGIQDFQAVTDCSIPGCTASDDCNPQAVNNYATRTGFPFKGITTTGYYYINSGTAFGGAFDQDEVQQFLSLLGLPSNCPVVLEGPPYTLMPVAQLTETQTITSAYHGQTAAPNASPGVPVLSTTTNHFLPSFPILPQYELTTEDYLINTLKTPIQTSATTPESSKAVFLSSVLGITHSSAFLSPSTVPVATTPTAMFEYSASSSLPQPPTGDSAAAFPTITLGSSTITANSALQYAIGSQTLVPGGPAITHSDTIISLAPSASAIAVNGIIQSLSPVSKPQVSELSPRPDITIGSSVISANTAGLYLVGTQTLSAGGPAITVAGTTISLAPSASNLIINGVTKSMPTTPTPLSANLPSTEPPLVLGSTTFTANSAGAYIFGTQTLLPGGSGIIVSGTTISLVASDTAIIVNGHTYSAETLPSTPKPYPAIATVDGDMLSLNPAGAYEIGSQTITPGGPAITIDGTPVSLETAATGIHLVVGGSTEVLTLATLTGGLEPGSTGGLGGVIFSGWGGLSSPSATGNVVVDTSAAEVRWKMGLWAYASLCASIVLGAVFF